MFRTLLIATALFASTTAKAEDGEIVLKVATDVAGALDRADTASGWVPVAATVSTAPVGADILISNSGNAAGDLEVTIDPGLLSATAWGNSVDGQYSVYAVDSIAFGPDTRTGALDTLEVDGVAQIAAPATLTWEQAAAEHVGYVIIDNLTLKAVTTIPIIFH